MSNNVISDFKYTGELVSLSVPTSDGKKKKKVEAGVYQATGVIERSDGNNRDPGRAEKFVMNKDHNFLVLLRALEERLKSGNEAQRKADYEAVKADKQYAFELWSIDGTLNSVPRNLIPTNKGYNDGLQWRRWSDFASKLGGKPPSNINPVFARFRLKPSEQHREIITVYFTPSDDPVCSIDVEKLEAIVVANKDRFTDWPKYKVLKFCEAKRLRLKPISKNFFLFYVTWIEEKDYERLWREWRVTALPLGFPARDGHPPQAFKDIDAKLKKGSRQLDGLPVHVNSHKVMAATGNREGQTQTIMGQSATTVANDIWGANSPTSGMGQSKAEWLHRNACIFGGLDQSVSLTSSNDPGNLVFGTWECNTEMIRVENMITEAIRKRKDDAKKTIYSGTLTTTNKLSGAVSRRGLSLEDISADIPGWLQEAKYPWLSFQLDYQWIMPAVSSPLGHDLNTEAHFEPWSLYVPLHIEPRLDVMVLNHLKDERVKTQKKDLASTLILPDSSSKAVSNQSLSLPALPLPELDFQTAEILAWRAATGGLPFLELPGLYISHPTVGQPPQTADSGPVQPEAAFNLIPPPEGYILEGKIKLFGTSLVGQLSKWKGPPPEGVVVGDELPCIERVTLSGDFQMSMLLPLLKGTPFDSITFQNVAFYRQNYAFDKTKAIGWHFNADWVIDQKCGLLHDILTQALQVNRHMLSIYAFLGERQSWECPLKLHSFTLEGVFSDLTLSPVPGLCLTSIGIRLLGIRGFRFSPNPGSTLSYGFSIFGEMKLDVPGSVSPLDLSYEMGLAGSTVNLSAEVSGQVWENALGIDNLVLEDTLFTMSFHTSKPWKSFSFDVSATFWYLTSRVSLMGSYASGGRFSLEAGFDKFGTEEIDSIFSTLFSDSLSLPDFDVKIGSASLSIVSGMGLSVSLSNVDIAGYAARTITVTFNTSGASLSGALSSKLLPFGEVGLRNGVVQLAFWSSNKKKQVEFMLGGLLTVDFLGVDVKALVHLYHVRGKFEWAVFAELAAPGQSFAISDVVRDIKDSFLDFSLKNVLFIATSQDNLAIEQLYPEYRIRKGVQVLGVIDRIPPLNTLLKQDVSNLVLSAGWSKVSGFNLAVSLPAASSLDLGNGIRTKPISLAIRTKPVELAVIAGLTVSVKDSTPLDFSFVLAANLTGASASAEMKGWWVKPFGIDNLKIGEIVLLSIEIIYAQFVSTGTPSGFGLAGGLKIGQVEAHVALNVSAEPRRQMLSARVKELGISDLVDFAGELIQERIPSIPENILRFEELRVYICPFGIVQGTTTYPQGFSFRANMMFLEKRAEIECKIDQVEKSIGISGSIQNFKLGPLSLRGSNGPQAELKCHIGVLRQQLAIDGVVSLFDLQSQTCIDMQFMPEPKFKFFVSLKFAKIFMFQLNAELIGSLGQNLDGADFSLRAELQNDILRYVAQQVVEEFEAAKVFAAKGLEAAQEKVKKAEKEWKAMITGAEKKVDEARKNWESYEKTVRSSSQPVIDNYLSEISRLQNNIEEARKAFESALQDARAAVEQANRDRGAALAAANRDVERAKYDVDRGIAEAHRALDYARADLSAAFGNAQQAINNAQWEVWSLQNQIYHVKGIIRDYERAPWYHFWKKAAIAGLWSAVLGLEASKAVASGILDAARAVLWSAEYLSKEGAVRAAQSALVAARETGRLSLSAAQGALTAADETSKFAVERANNVLLGVEKGAQFAAFQGAIKALQVYKDANKVAYDVAVTAIEGLMDCAALTAFTLAKVGLRVAKTSTALLDAAKEGLALAKKATEKVIEILKEMVRLGATALNITRVVLSGTVRGVFGVEGEKSRPLSAAVGGYFLGNRFDFELVFNPKDFIAFFKAIFERLWRMITDSNSFSVTNSGPEEDNQVTPRPASAYESEMHALMPSDVILDDSRHFTLARKRFVPVHGQISSEAVDESVAISIPCSPFTGTQIFPPHVVVGIADRMLQEDGLSVRRIGL